MYSLIFMSSCILFRIYCKNSELLRSQIQSVHKNVYVENVKKRGVFGRLMGKRVSLKKYWEYKRLEYYLYSESAKFFLWWGNRQLSAYACYMDKRGLVVYPPKVLLNLEQDKLSGSRFFILKFRESISFRRDYERGDFPVYFLRLLIGSQPFFLRIVWLKKIAEKRRESC